MNILFLNTIGGYLGGVEQNIALTARGLTEKGHTCYFACDSIEGRSIPEFSSNFERSFLLSKTSLQEICREIALDVMYVHKLEHISRVLQYRGKIRIVKMVHDHDLYCPRKHKYYFHNRSICTHPAGWRCWLDLAFIEKEWSRGRVRWHYRSIPRHIQEMKRNMEVDAVLAGSSYMRQQLVQNGFPEDQIFILPPAIPPVKEPFSPLPKEKRILYTGQLVRGKGVDLLLEALSELTIPFKCDIVGTGNDEAYLHRLCEELDLDQRVTFHGWIPHRQLPALYDRARCFAVPSRWPEPFGMVGLEAMQRARPVVAFESGGIPDWLDDAKTGFLAAPGDFHSLSEKIERLLVDYKLAAAMGKQGAERASKHFSFSAYLNNLEKMLDPASGYGR